MQTASKVKNLITNIYYSYNNNNVKHYFIVKRNSKVKHIKQYNKYLTNVYANLFKSYKLNKQQLNLIQFCYYYNNNSKLTTKYYNIAQRNAINKALQAM